MSPQQVYRRMDAILEQVALLHRRLDAPTYGPLPQRPEYTREQIQRQSDEAMRLYWKVMR